MNASTQSDKGRFPEWRALLGFMGEPAAWRYVNAQGVPLDGQAQETLRSRVREAVSTVAVLPDRSTVRPQVKPLPSGAEERTGKLESEPSFKLNLVGTTGHEWGLIDISKVRCFQPNLNLEYVQDLIKRAPKSDDFASLHSFCQPLKGEGGGSALLTGFNSTTNTFTIVSENLDLRILGQVQGDAEQGGMTGKMAGFVYGFGLRQLTVAEYKGMYLLKNGYHRAYALMERGITNIPALVVHVDSYESTGAAGSGFFPLDLVLSNKAPLMQDYVTKAAVNVPRRRLRLMVSVHAEVQVVAT